MLMQLIQKDLRICRLPILVGVTTVIGGFATSAMMYGFADLWRSGSAEVWGSMLETGSSLSLITSAIALTMLAGTIIAAERTDRSSEFLAYLPPSRIQILLSKAIVLGGASLLALCIGGGGFAVAARLSDGGAANSGFHLPLPDLVRIGLVSIGVGWCASARFENTGPSVGLGFAAPLFVSAAVHLTKHLSGIPGDESLGTTISTSCAVTGMVCMVVGSVYFIRRVEP